MYKHVKVNYNKSEVKEVKDRELYALFLRKNKRKFQSAQIHRGAPCIEPERHYFQEESGDSDFE